MKTFLAIAVLLPGLLAAADDLEKLRDKQDRPGLEKAALALQAAAEKAPSADAWYKAAIAQSYAAEVAMEQRDKPGSQRQAESGVRDMEKGIALNNKTGDYYRVLGTLCGQVIPANPIAGILSYGKRAKDALEKAIAIDPKSAKAHIARGVGNYYLPANFGGGPDQAIADFQQAISLDPKNAEAYLWLGMAQNKKKAVPQAREAFQKSLQLNADRIWTKQQLDKLPLQ